MGISVKIVAGTLRETPEEPPWEAPWVPQSPRFSSWEYPREFSPLEISWNFPREPQWKNLYYCMGIVVRTPAVKNPARVSSPCHVPLPVSMHHQVVRMPQVRAWYTCGTLPVWHASATIIPQRQPRATCLLSPLLYILRTYVRAV